MEVHQLVPLIPICKFLFHMYSADMEDPFKKNVRKLVEHVCKNLVPKTYNGKSHTGETLLEHIKTCYRIMKGAKLDLTKTLVEV